MPKASGHPHDRLSAKAGSYRNKAKAARRRALASASNENRLGLLALAKSYEALAGAVQGIAGKRVPRQSSDEPE